MLAWLLLCDTPNAIALEPVDFAVLVTAEVQESPPQILLRWPLVGAASRYTVSRKLLADQNWSTLATLPGNATNYRDASVVAGAAYEYEIAQLGSDDVRAYGYIYAGASVSFPNYRGRVLLIVDSSIAGAVATGLEVLQRDLIGDGWTVKRRDVNRSDSPGSVRSMILSEFWADPANTKAVLLFGHVPVPYSGDLNPDEHNGHRGAWPADAFYGVIEGNWTDYAVHSTNAEDPRNHNRPGDGKYDQSELPGRVVLQVGRVDFADLPAFQPRSEVDLLRQYLDKNHRFRHKVFTPERRGLIRDNFGEIQGDAPATDAWRAFVPFFGDNVQAIGSGQFFSRLSGASYLFAYGGGGGGYYSADGVGSTSDFANHSPQCVFYMLHGSYFGDWDSSNNFLRASLASSGYGLAAAWTGLPHWYLHHMALGETIGLSTLVTQNNRTVYKNQVNLAVGQVHIALMGDPTLRMHTVAPPSNLSAISGGSDSVVLTWSPSSEPVQGYYVYRADAMNAPFSRFSRRFVTGNSYTDTAVPGGPKTYMVRAVKLERSGSGTYYNPSQGAFAAWNGGGGGPVVLPTVRIESANPSADEDGPVEGAFAIVRSGSAVSALPVQFAISGSAANGTDYESISSSVTIPANWDTAWITIRPIADTQREGPETVTLTLSPSSAYTIGAPASATVTIADRFINQAPSLAPLANVTTLVNSAVPPVTLTVSDAETPAAQLIVSAISSNPALLPSSGLLLSGTDQSRVLLLQLVPDVIGTANVTVTVSDGALSSSRTFALTVFGPGKIYSINRQPTGAPALQFDGTPGRAYSVHSSKDLKTWTTVQSGIFQTPAPVSVVDLDASDEPCRFYRVQWE
jgi:hypothetical protein